jgi:hypothetical protein
MAKPVGNYKQGPNGCGGISTTNLWVMSATWIGYMGENAAPVALEGTAGQV